MGCLLFSCQKTNDLTELSDSFTLRRDGADMPVYVHGNASEKVFVLTLHGGPADGGLTLRIGGWSDKLEEKYAMVYWDQRGAGMAQGDLSKENLNLEVMQEDVLALVALLKHKYGDDITFFLFGQSWGTTLGSSILVEGNNQDLFKGWMSSATLYDFCSSISDLTVAYTRLANEQIAANNDVAYWNDNLALVADVDTTTCKDYRLNAEAANGRIILTDRGVINKSHSDFTSFTSNIVVTGIIPSALNKSIVNEFLFEDEDFADLSLTDKLSNITIPTVVLHGKYDMNVALETGKKYYNLIGSTDKTFVQFDKSPHQIFQTETDLFGEEIINFIELYK